MAAIEAEAVPAPAGNEASGWRKLAQSGAIVTTLMTFVIQFLAGGVIPPLVVFAVLYIVGAVLLSRGAKAGVWMLVILPVLFLALNAPFLFPQLGHPETVADFAPSIVFLVASLVTFIGALGVLRGAAASAAPKAIGIAAILVVVAANLASGVMSSGVEKASAEAGDIAVQAEGAEFAPTELDAEAGLVAVHIANVDPIRHTFTIDDLDVSVELPGNAASRVEFEAAAGTYEFYCTVAGHEDMTGTLVVR